MGSDLNNHGHQHKKLEFRYYEDKNEKLILQNKVDILSELSKCFPVACASYGAERSMKDSEVIKTTLQSDIYSRGNY